MDGGQTEAGSDHSGIEASVIVPALNEEATIAEVVNRLLALPLKLQIIVVNDGSSDGTAQILAKFGDRIDVVTNSHPTGKGASIRTALDQVTGPAVAIQDADLEYRPEELEVILAPIIGGSADFVLGSRFSHGLTPGMALPNKIVNRLLVWAVMLLYGKRITDEATCYKAIRTEYLRTMDLQCRRFEFCPEVVAKSCRLGLRLTEVPISYSPRSIEAGKKIRWTDAPEAFWTLIRHRFWRPKRDNPHDIT